MKPEVVVPVHPPQDGELDVVEGAPRAVALGWADWALLAAVSMPIFLITEGVKVVRSRRNAAA